MITLHNEKETNFRRNGYGVLDDLFNTAPQGSWELNGEFKISFEVPFFADVEKTSHLVNGNILQVPVPHMERQLFRIYRSEKSLGYVQGEARHIFYDLLDNFIEDTNIQNQPGNNAIQQILNNTVYGHRFTGSSNINDRNANARVVRMNPVEAILDDGRSNSFVSRWSGEIVRNNFDIEMLQQRGSDNGVTIRHRENLMGYHATIDHSTVVTRVRPVGFDGLTLPELYVDSPLMDEEHPIIKEYEFRDVKAAIGEYADDEDAIPLEDAYDELRRLAEEEFSVHHVDEPESTIDVDFIQLKNMVGYEDLQEIQEVKAGDTVTVTVPDEHFDVTSRLVAFEWNPLIEDEYTNTTLGNHVREFTSNNQGQNLQRDLEEVQEQVVQAMQAANGRNTNWRGDANPNDLDLDDWNGLRLGDYYTQSNGEHYIVYQFVEVAGERYFTELINTAHTDEASRRVEEALEEAQEAKAQVERESEERRADIQAESERLSTEWNERIEENEQIVEGVRHSTEELMNDFDRALTQANFTSIEDLTTTLNSRSLEAIENAERADGFAIEALDVANGFGTRITDVESTVDGQVTSINTAVETAERVERTISEVTTDVDGLSSRFVSMEADIEGITNTVSDYEGRISRTEQRADGLYDIVHDPNTGLLTEVGQIAEGWQVTAQRIDDMNEDMATQADITVLHNAIDLAVEEGDVIGRLNIQAGHTLIQNGEILMDADTVRFTGSAFIPNAAIEELHADKITAGTIDAARIDAKLIVTEGLEADVIEADHIKADTAIIEKLFATEANIDVLTSQEAFIDQLSASNLEIDGGRVHGTLNGNSLNFVNIDVNSLSGNLSEFVRTQWNNAAGGTVYIDGSGFHSTGVIYTELGNENATIDIYDGTIYLEQDLWASPSNRELAQIELRAGAMSMAQAQRIATLSPSQGLYMQDHLTDEVTHINYSGLTTWEGNNQTHFGVNGIRLDNGAFWERLGPSSDGMEWSVPGFMHFSAWGERAFSVYSSSVNFGRDVFIIGNSLAVRNMDAHALYDSLRLNQSRTDLGQLELGKYGSGARWVRSTSIYDHGISSSSNVGITASGDLRRITSARRYKENIQTVDNALECGKNLLKLDMKMWQDKNALDLNGEDGQDPQRWYYGLIAEEVWKSGLEEFVETENGRIEGLYYDRLWIPLIPVIKQHDYLLNQHTDYINELSEAINLLVENKANSTEVDKLKKRVKELEKKVKRLEGAA